MKAVVLFVTAACAFALAACGKPAATHAELTAHGEYLVERVMFCGNCHTPWGEGGPDHTRAFQGAPTGLSAPLAEYAPAIAGIPAHFTADQFVALLTAGVRPDGTSPRDPMPRYRLSEADARAVAAYIASFDAPAGGAQ